MQERVLVHEAVLAAGCFWHVEEYFSKINGVIKTEVGYCGGHTKNPSYEEVCSGRTGHAEAVKITFDPNLISYAELLDHFWKCHDPSSNNRQGDDIGNKYLGTQYRSAIFWMTEEQKNIAEQSKDDLDENYRSQGKNVKTDIAKFRNFYPAEAYHQKYYQKKTSPKP